LDRQEIDSLLAHPTVRDELYNESLADFDLTLFSMEEVLDKNVSPLTQSNLFQEFLLPIRAMFTGGNGRTHDVFRSFKPLGGLEEILEHR
jgi:hypothetical protein